MRAGYKASVLGDLDRLFRRGTAPSEDGALLDRFLTGGDESAFEDLIARHGPMVLGVCRRLLGTHDADDAFQATFLVLARKAGRLSDPGRLGPWLYGVARRVATKARMRAARHRLEPLVEGIARERLSVEWSDLMPILDAELGRLPTKHRDVLVLCLLEGASVEEAADRLGCPVGTVKSRLARGRQSLRDRLLGRGIAPAIALAASSGEAALAASVHQALICETLGAITTAAVAPGVFALTQGVTQSMLLKSTVTASVLAGGIALAAMGAATWMRPSQAQEPGNVARIPGQPSQDRRQVQTNNLKQILLAFHNYMDSTGRFPATTIYGPDGLPKLSWRVALLPYLGQDELYRQFHQDEPWNSPHNKALAAGMPAVFETPGSPAPAGQTCIRGFVGKGAVFDGPVGSLLEDITDGTSNTLLLAIAVESVPWTKPGELPFVEGLLLPALLDGDPNGYQIGLADGSVRTLPIDAARLLPSLITRASGEVISWPQAGPSAAATTVEQKLRPTAPVVPPTTPGGGMMGMMMPGPPLPIPPLEQRIQRMEEKLDQILKKLDTAFPEAPKR